ncbi:MAG: hypothetical protein FD138_1365 [Planctomycetota bacterium]|nr:MAG: hypothetical protein FD138_1365 [Planctomycetota bacterium]
MPTPSNHSPIGFSRRQLLGSLGAGFGTLALADLLQADEAKSLPNSATHHVSRAKHVIFLFMAGGPSHLDLFDQKPSLKKFAGQRPAGADLRTERVTGGLLPAPWEFRPGGQSGLVISDLLPRLRDCADDLCVVKSMVGGNPNHAPAANHLFSGRIDQIHPSLGAWVSYGLGTENRNLPSFVSLSDGGSATRYVRNGYLPGEHQATPINTTEKDADKMVRFLRNGTLDRQQQERQVEFITRLNRRQLDAAGDDPALEARIRAMETAFRMQFAAGDAFDLRQETQATQDEYGSSPFARGCLISRRLGSSREHRQVDPKFKPPDRPTDRRAPARLEVPRIARRDAGDLGRRIRSHAGLGKWQRPRSQSLRLHDVAGRWWHSRRPVLRSHR